RRSPGFFTLSRRTASGIGEESFQRDPTASSYDFPALWSEAITSTTRNHGWEARRSRNRWPTVPVAPRMAAGILRSPVPGAALVAAEFGRRLEVVAVSRFLARMGRP